MNYTDHYYSLGSVIRNTVSQAQDTLCGLQLGSIARRLRDYYASRFRDYDEPPGTTYPQSLGELCIELAQSSMAVVEWTLVENTPSFKQWSIKTVPRESTRRDIQELRTRLYHKHTDVRRELVDHFEDSLNPFFDFAGEPKLKQLNNKTGKTS
jgi:hypothetical protein